MQKRHHPIISISSSNTPGFSDRTACVSTAALVSPSSPSLAGTTDTPGSPSMPPTAARPLSSSGTASTRRRLVSPRVLASITGASKLPAASATCRAFQSR
jgi:hypothetical protein